MADEVLQHGVIGNPDDLAPVTRQHDVVAPVIADDLRLDARAGKVRRRIHMRADADDGHVVLVAVRRDGRIDIAMLVEMRVGDADLEQFLDQQAAEIFLLLGRGLGRGLGVGLGVDDDVAEETVGNADGHGRIQTAKGPFFSGARPSREWGICLRSRDGQGSPGEAAASPAAGCGSRTGAKIEIDSLRPAKARARPPATRSDLTSLPRPRRRPGSSRRSASSPAPGARRR